jgi:hypothetical protein
MIKENNITVPITNPIKDTLAWFDEFSVECLFQFFQPTWKADLKVIQIIKNDLFWVDAPL